VFHVKHGQFFDFLSFSMRLRCIFESIGYLERLNIAFLSNSLATNLTSLLLPPIPSHCCIMLYLIVWVKYIYWKVMYLITRFV
jgi:hypothetical protein